MIDIEWKGEYMKRFLSIIFIFVLSFFGFVACNKEEEPDLSAEQLATAKTAAIEQLEAYVGALKQSDYGTEEWNSIQSKLVETKAAINQCTDEAEVDSLISAAKTFVDGVKKIDVLAIAKEDAIARLDEFVAGLTESDYDVADWVSIQNKLSERKGLVNAATAVSSVEALVNAFISEVEAIEKIDLVGDEKEKKIKDLNIIKATYFEEDYTAETWQKILKLFEDSVVEINEATTVMDVKKAFMRFEDALYSFLTKEEEESITLNEKILEFSQKVEEEFAKYTETDYDASSWLKLKNTKDEMLLEIASVNLNNYTLEEALLKVEEFATTAINEMSAVKKLISIKYYNIEDSTWVYDSVQAIRDELLKDYNTVLETTYTAEDLPFGAWENNDFHKMFYATIGEVSMKAKWLWIADYFVAVGGTSNRGPCGKLKNFDTADAFHNDNKNVNVYAVSYEFRAFIKGTKFTANANFQSADYSLDSVNEKVWEYLGAQEVYVHGTTYVIPEPARKYQDFLGWYDNPDFTGDPITQITEADSNIELYAKWSELTAEGELSMYKEAKVAELKAYLDATKDASKYNAAAWELVEKTLKDQVENINAQADNTTIDSALEAAKAALDALLPTNYIVNYELNGGNWKFSSKEEAMNAFLADFAAYAKTTVTTETFFSSSYGKVYGFFNDNPGWKWFVEYIASIRTDKADQFDLSDKESYFPQLRIEIVGYITATAAENGNYKSYDYSSYTEDLGFLDFLKTTQFEYVEEVELETPIKVGYKFIGWYTNAEFSGEVVTTVSEACTLYAKFEELTDEDVLNAQKIAAKSALDEYVSETKDYNKFTEEDKALFEAKVDELKAAIDAATTLTAVDESLVKAKEEVDAFAYSTYVVEFVLDGGHWLYENKAALVNAFIADFHTLRSAVAIDALKTDFFAKSWTQSGVITQFFTQFTKWHWFLTYLSTKCDPAKAQYFALGGSDIQMPHVRAEIDGYINNYQYKHSSGSYVSADYTGNENDLGFVEYLQQDKLEFLGTTDAPKAYKAGYVLAGWYDNPEFTGEAVTTITGATKLYAKWEVAATE